MIEILSDAYWTAQFAITQAYLDRLAAFIDSSGYVQHLSTLTKRMINGRPRPLEGIDLIPHRARRHGQMGLCLFLVSPRRPAPTQGVARFNF